jgi:hypothetical protein
MAMDCHNLKSLFDLTNLTTKTIKRNRNIVRVSIPLLFELFGIYGTHEQSLQMERAALDSEEFKEIEQIKNLKGLKWVPSNTRTISSKFTQNQNNSKNPTTVVSKIISIIQQHQMDIQAVAIVYNNIVLMSHEQDREVIFDHEPNNLKTVVLKLHHISCLWYYKSELVSKINSCHGKRQIASLDVHYHTRVFVLFDRIYQHCPEDTVSTSATSNEPRHKQKHESRSHFSGHDLEFVEFAGVCFEHHQSGKQYFGFSRIPEIQ